MIEVETQGGLERRFLLKDRFVWKYGFYAALMLLVVGLAGGTVLGAEKPVKKPVQKAPVRKGVLPKKGAKAPVHSKKPVVKGRVVVRGKSGAKASGHVAVPFKPQYTVARPIQDLPRQQPKTPVETAPGDAVPEDSVPVVQVPAGQEPSANAAELADSVLVVPVGGPFRNAHALDRFFKALAEQQAAPAGRTDAAKSGAGASTVRVMQYGDSHTAADIFTGEMRALLQARFGNGGLGYQYPGHPFAGYRLAGSTRSETSGWLTQGNRFNDLGDGDTGLGGIAISTRRPGEAVSLSTTCETLQVQYLRQPGGGSVDFSDNLQPVSEIKTGVETEGDATGDPAGDVTRGTGTFTYSCSPGMHDFQLITMDSAPVRLLGWVTEQPGITYECLGINGAVATLMLRWNQQMFADYLGQRNPNLIVLAYGTNEATGSGSHNDEYVAQFHQLLQNLHRVVPGASILVLGPYDRALKHGRGRRASWSTATAIDRIIEDQKEACKVDDCAFYDQRARMGGPGVMSRWVSRGLAQPDHTHLTGTGYRVLANALYRDLMSVYNTYLLTARP